MSKKRVFTKMVSKDAKYQPAIRVEFRGRFQSDYFSLKKTAETDFDGLTQTGLARLIICDWLKKYRDSKENGVGPKTQQMVMILTGTRDGVKQKKEEKEGN